MWVWESVSNRPSNKWSWRSREINIFRYKRVSSIWFTTCSKIYFCTSTSDFVYLLYHRRYCNVKNLFRSVTSRALVHFEMLLVKSSSLKDTRDRILPISSLIWEMDRASRYLTSRSENNLWRITLIFESILHHVRCRSHVHEISIWQLQRSSPRYDDEKRNEYRRDSYRRLGTLYHLGHFSFRYSIIDDLDTG